MEQIGKKQKKYSTNYNKCIILYLLLFIISNLFYAQPETYKGYASWYGPNFNGQKTANGETYNMYDLTAAHKTLPFNTYIKVTNLENNKTVVVRINDRGPFIKNRIIDLSYQAAREIDLISKGTCKVKLEVVEKSKKNSQNGTELFIYIAKFSHINNAKKFKKKFENKFKNIKILKRKNYFVLLGPYSSMIEANKTLKRLKYYKYEGKIINGSCFNK
ncbi:MAG: septal ring lytic transglycosylase RlpA family protein [Candidatus Mcinerneyibacterium aminivorans]|uniref:Probable endolytic peptidoglycan transglycosylase RlpA n=1 Tax=Candidatus Mcinerneyibacterium aminivorans TaxID=2703815 RepID=A0A5D0MHY0_9BACT|nr:MAG: septal ring lytic transglycosylase RlpA family protein [Candidatus Mcinerneyibacterium aminivorans]